MSLAYQIDHHFFGAGTFPVAADNAPGPFVGLKTGSCTIAYATPTAFGGVDLAMANGNEVQNACLYGGDKLYLDIDNIRELEIVAAMPVALGSNGSVAFGLAGARNAAIDSIAQAALFRLIANTAVVVETDDGTIDNDDVATGLTLTTSLKRFVISFAKGKSDVRFFMDDASGNLVRVCSGTTFSMANYAGSLQPFVQLQKASSTDTGTCRIARMSWSFRES